MLRLTLRSVRGHLGRFVLTLFAVSLGIAFLAGSFVLTDGLRKTFDDLVQASAAGVDVTVRSDQQIDVTDATTAGGRLPLTLEDTLREVDGAARVSPDIQGSILLVGKDGTAVRSGNGGAPTLGFAWADDDPAFELVDGRAPERSGEVAVVSSTLEQSGLAVGDRTRALVGQTPTDVTVVGEFSFDGPLAGATLSVLDRASALAAFSPDGQVPSFSVTAADGVSQVELAERISGVLPAGAEAVTGEELQDETREQIDTVLGFFNIFLGVFAGISLFVGAFIIWNTFSMLVAQRGRELALLRAVGAARGQVMRSVVGEAVVVGLVGSLVGIGLGLGLAAVLQPALRAIGIESSGDLPLATRTVVASLVVGLVVTVVAAIVPALRASRISPVEAMRDDVAVTPKGLRSRILTGGVMTIAGVGAIVAGLVRDDIVWSLVGVGAFLTVVGVIVASPVATRPVVRVVAWPFVAVTGTVGRLARENSLRNPRRTASTASALMIGLALIAGISVLAESTKASVRDVVESQVTSDYVLTGDQAPFPTAVADEVAALPDVEAVAPIRFLDLETADGDLSAGAADAASLGANVALDVTSGSLAALDDGEVLVNATTAEDRDLSVGSTIAVDRFGTLTDQTVTVGGVFEDTQAVAGSVLVPLDLYDRAVPAPQRADFGVFVKAADGADLPALRSELAALVEPYITISVQDGDEFVDSQASQVNQLLAILYVLLALSVVIAILGIVNTLALSVLERTREIGLLRAVGLTRGQLFRMVSIESVATAVFGAVLGAVLGLGLGVALQRGLVSQGLEILSIPWATIVVMVALAAVAGLVAAVLPAIRATRLDVLKAITTE